MILGRVGLVVVVGMSLLAVGCGKKDETPADAPAATVSAAPVATPEPVAVPVPSATVTAPKVDYTADANAISACCAALRSEESKAKAPADKSTYKAAAASCGGLVDLIKSGRSSRASVMGTLRGQMKGKALPPGCSLTAGSYVRVSSSPDDPTRSA